MLREYGLPDPLIGAVWSLYDQCQSLGRIAGSKSDVFPVRVGLRLSVTLWEEVLSDAELQSKLDLLQKQRTKDVVETDIKILNCEIHNKTRL